MAITVFLLGRPGSGKSTAAHFIDLLARQQGCSTTHLNDYPFLFIQFEADIHHLKIQAFGLRRFRRHRFLCIGLSFTGARKERHLHIWRFLIHYY